mmetsp:Transcript_14886/g.24219  ORF Transcript_14886/g.24219 Transcript_14886/m.24219 type:complete len:201 (+) Transcript_14886:57-659(+)
MPRMLAPRRDSVSRRSIASLRGSRTSLNSYGSTTSRQTSSSNNYHGSQFSLRRSSFQNGSAQSSTHSLRHQVHQRQHNAVWNIEDQGSVSLGSPSLVNSDTSSSGSSSQSSLQPPSVQPPANSDALHRYYAIRRASLQHPTIMHPTISVPGSRGNSFLPSVQIKEEDTWGQFVETEDAEEDLVRRSRLGSFPLQEGIRRL